jgi:hypothetical protein
MSVFVAVRGMAQMQDHYEGLNLTLRKLGRVAPGASNAAYIEREERPGRST